jgi:glycine/D-amino acid oxidase-like deaminating enzyme/nitrite reductase/ring-hydroxylating ferredoxin subunit
MYDPHKTNGDTQSLWYSELPDGDKSVLSGTDELFAAKPQASVVDVVVVGAGIAGLSVAYHLCRRGRSVVVLDKGWIGSGETGRTTAHLSSALDDRYTVLERRHGEVGAQIAAASHVAAIDDIESIVAAEAIDCGFARVPGHLYSVHSGADAERELEQELAAARRAGLQVDLEHIAGEGFGRGPRLCFAAQAEFQPLAYLAGLARAIVRMGGRITTCARVVGFDAGKSQTIVHLPDDRSVTAGALVVATNTPINDVVAMHTKQAAYRSYVLALRIPRGSLPRVLAWDTGDPYHYVRVAGEGELLVVGGEDHKVGQSSTPERAWARLETWARENFPMAGSVSAHWSGQIQEPADGLAYIGKNPGGSSNVFIATGDSGNGITHGALAGLLISELVCDRTHPWAALYDPGRIVKPALAGDFLRENTNVALHFAHGLLQPTQAADHADRMTPRGVGRVVRRGLRHFAVYVDERGQAHECSATCPHLGCVVAWNPAEQSWDCPCHGSRFDPYGRMMTGPAVKDLEASDAQGDEPLNPLEAAIRGVAVVPDPT